MEFACKGAILCANFTVVFFILWNCLATAHFSPVFPAPAQKIWIKLTTAPLTCFKGE